ncbi:MAG: hypothetical protein JEY79_07240 [Pseudodesulfovibrio sp.]|nr:hypothetical protein [Pseudodesulfovibrio sp.]
MDHTVIDKGLVSVTRHNTVFDYLCPPLQNADPASNEFDISEPIGWFLIVEKVH